MELGIPLLVFCCTAVVVVTAAVGLASAGDTIATRTGWGRVWVGTLLLAGATSLPELVTTSTASWLNAADLAAGNVFGSNMFNMVILTLTIGFFSSASIYNKLSRNQIRVALLAISLTGIATLMGVLDFGTKWVVFSPAALIILTFYFGSSHFIYKQGSDITEPRHETRSWTLRKGWTIFLLSSLGILVAAPFMASSAHDIAQTTGISESFIGVLAVAFVSSLPEMVTTVAALRIGAADLAVANIYGTNAFNMLALAIADFFYKNDSLFGQLDNSALIAGGVAILMMIVGCSQLLMGRSTSWKSSTGVGSLSILVLYGIGLALVFYTS